MEERSVWSLIPNETADRKTVRQALAALRQRLQDKQARGEQLSNDEADRLVAALRPQPGDWAAYPPTLLALLATVPPCRKAMSTLVRRGLVTALAVCFEDDRHLLLVLDVVQELIYTVGDAVKRRLGEGGFVAAIAAALLGLSAKLSRCAGTAAAAEPAQREAVVLAETLDMLVENCPDNVRLVGRPALVAKQIIAMADLLRLPAATVPLQLMLLQLVFRLTDARPLDFRSRRWWAARFPGLPAAVDAWLAAREPTLGATLRSVVNTVNAAAPAAERQNYSLWCLDLTTDRATVAGSVWVDFAEHSLSCFLPDGFLYLPYRAVARAVRRSADDGRLLVVELHTAAAWREQRPQRAVVEMAFRSRGGRSVPEHVFAAVFDRLAPTDKCEEHVVDVESAAEQEDTPSAPLDGELSDEEQAASPAADQHRRDMSRVAVVRLVLTNRAHPSATTTEMMDSQRRGISRVLRAQLVIPTTGKRGRAGSEEDERAQPSARSRFGALAPPAAAGHFSSRAANSSGSECREQCSSSDGGGSGLPQRVAAAAPGRPAAKRQRRAQLAKQCSETIRALAAELEQLKGLVGELVDDEE